MTPHYCSQLPRESLLVNKYSLGVRWPRESLWWFLVVLLQPLLGLLSDFMQALKHEHINHRFTVVAIESFDEAVLNRPAVLRDM